MKKITQKMMENKVTFASVQKYKPNRKVFKTFKSNKTTYNKQT